MKELQIFSNEQFGEIRTVNLNGKVYFCGSDIAKALGYSDTPKAIKQHCKKDGWAFRPVIDKMGREQKIRFINEGNLYRLIVNSKLPAAEQFESWVFDEVLPSIRKTGTYTAKPSEQYKQELIETRKRNIKIREAQILYKISEKCCPEYQQVLHSNITFMLTGKQLLPLPEVDKRTYNAAEIGERLGISAHRVGMIANARGLKTPQYGKWFYDKAKSANKQVETFRYFDNVIKEIENYII